LDNEDQRTDDEPEDDLEPTFEDVSLPDSVEGFSDRRVALVKRAAKEWASALIDLGGRNNLLRYRDLRAGTLDLTNVSPVAVETLLASKPVRASALFPDPEARALQLRRVRTIHNKAKENFEERGIETLSLACGLATWENKRASGWRPCAPVLLRQAVLRSLGAAQDEFELELLDEMEVNPTLMHVLKVDFDCDLPQEALLERVDGVIDEVWELHETYKWLAEHASRVSGFSIDPRLVLTNFAYAKLPMVRDIETSFDLLVEHDLIAAIAGDEEARQTIREMGPGPDAVPTPDSIPLADEFLVLDADSSQNYAINAVLGGTSLIVRGPPGTGKSQTIANLIGSLMARNKKVLFVAEKRAAIDAVVKRLHQKKLDEYVLDLHGGAGSRRAFAERIGKALLANRQAPRFDGHSNQQEVERNREHLTGYVSALHQQRKPWGRSIYEMRAELIGLGSLQSELRFGSKQLENLSEATCEHAESNVRDFARFGGFSLPSSNSPWREAKVMSTDEAEAALHSVDELRRSVLPETLDSLRRAAHETGLPAADNVADWQPTLKLWEEVAATLTIFRPGVYEAPLDGLCGQMAPASAGGFARMKASLFSAEYKSARRELRALVARPDKLGDDVLVARAGAASDQMKEWREAGGDGMPRLPGHQDLQQLWEELRGRIAAVGELVRSDVSNLAPVDLDQHLRSLVEDRSTLLKLPELHRIENDLREAGFGQFLDELTARAASEDVAVRELRGVWFHSIIDSLVFAEIAIGTFDAKRHQAVINDYRSGDEMHIETTPGRIRRGCAENFVRVRQAHPQQDQLLLAQAKLKRRHQPVRDVVRKAEDVLLALKPCWAMSPLLVSQLLPPRTMFDVVIFDEASQITPADAIPSIVRGAQLVVAGDDHQLPPTSFFVSESREEEGEEEAGDDEVAALQSIGLAGTRGFESILDALNVILRWQMLRWHYRSRDERLIAFSNAHIYDRMLTTFPGVGGGHVLRWVEVPWHSGGETNSPSAEVNRVVNLIIEHARSSPDESLGVIAMGIKHAERIEDCLRERLQESPALADEIGDFLAEDKEERFFVKNLERVQGDERDAIILSIGYGKNANGQLPLRFGPLLVDGGERRLNVAVTRAKHRATLVSSFNAGDIDLAKTNAAGVHLLRQYLQYVGSEGANFGDAILEKPLLNPFEVDVRDTFAARGLNLTPQYGTSGYWIDYVAPHPTQPGRYVLAIECDGASYHSSESARDRDRLRQSQLERLGWTFCRIWSSEWFYNKESVVDQVLAVYKQAVEDADKPPEPKRERNPERDQNSDSALIADDIAEQVRAAYGKPNNLLPPQRDTKGRPNVAPGYTIESYTLAELVRLVRWIKKGDHIYTEDELVRELMRELDFRRLGAKIETKFKQAIRQARD
jgi:very-short-patch-repair endonuclease